MSDTRSPSRGSTTGTVLILVVLACVALGGLVALGVPSLPDTTRNIPAPGEEGRRAEPRLAVADFDPGTEFYDHVRSFGDVEGLKFLNPAEVDLYAANGAGAARVAVSSRLPEGRVLVVVTRMADREAALRAADQLDELQLTFGLSRRPAEDGVHRVVEVAPDAGAENPDAKPTGRAHYVHDELLVRVELNARSADHLAGFGHVLAEQLKALPADG